MKFDYESRWYTVSAIKPSLDQQADIPTFGITGSLCEAAGRSDLILEIQSHLSYSINFINRYMITFINQIKHHRPLASYSLNFSIMLHPEALFRTIFPYVIYGISTSGVAQHFRAQKCSFWCLFFCSKMTPKFDPKNHSFLKPLFWTNFWAQFLPQKTQ